MDLEPSIGAAFVGCQSVNDLDAFPQGRCSALYGGYNQPGPPGLWRLF
jgi:hypothetical protein